LIFSKNNVFFRPNVEHSPKMRFVKFRSKYKYIWGGGFIMGGYSNSGCQKRVFKKAGNPPSPLPLGPLIGPWKAALIIERPQEVVVLRPRAGPRPPRRESHRPRYEFFNGPREGGGFSLRRGKSCYVGESTPTPCKIAGYIYLSSSRRWGTLRLGPSLWTGVLALHKLLGAEGGKFMGEMLNGSH